MQPPFRNRQFTVYSSQGGENWRKTDVKLACKAYIIGHFPPAVLGDVAFVFPRPGAPALCFLAGIPGQEDISRK